jgi:hypothetical protein
VHRGVRGVWVPSSLHQQTDNAPANTRFEPEYRNGCNAHLKRFQETSAWQSECSGVARRPKIGTEISISASSSIGTESSKSASNSTIRSPDPHAAVTQAIRKTFPDLCPRFEKMSMESRKDSKAAKTALHVCARVIVPAIKRNPEQGTDHTDKSLPQLAGSFRRRRGVG